MGAIRSLKPQTGPVTVPCIRGFKRTRKLRLRAEVHQSHPLSQLLFGFGISSSGAASLRKTGTGCWSSHIYDHSLNWFVGVRSCPVRQEPSSSCSFGDPKALRDRYE